MAGGHSDGRLAVALRSSKRTVCIMVYEVLPGADVAVSLGAAALCEARTELAEPLVIKVPFPLSPQRTCLMPSLHLHPCLH